MTRPTEVVIGIDVGTTSMKARAYSLDGEIVGHAHHPTEWSIDKDGRAQIDIDVLADTAMQVMAASVPSQHSHGSVVGIGITGMAETGVLIDSRSRPVMPAIAWYDERGKLELEELAPHLSKTFSATTGLAFKAECSFSKLLWRHRSGEEIPTGAHWLNALEYIAFRLTGRMATEPSLASRTGFMNQSSATPWNETLELVGATESLIPETLNAGHSLGNVLESAPRSLRGAAVTIAGHDHLVGAVGAGAFGVDDLYNSCGTADVMLRSVPRTLTNQERAALVTDGLSAGRHVLPHTTAILGATRSGLVLGRILSMLGFSDRESRQAIADSWTPSTTDASEVAVVEPPAWTNELVITLRSDVDPNDVWNAAMNYTLAATKELLASMEQVVGPHKAAVAAGGWAQLDGVFRGKSSIISDLRRFSGEEPGALGAAALASIAAQQNQVPLAAAVAARFESLTPKELVS